MMSPFPTRSDRAKPYCATRGLQLVETFIEPGASTTNDRGPEFQRMIEAGTSKPAPFDVVVVRKSAATARQRIRREGGGYRRSLLRALAQRVEVAEGEVRITGSKFRLLQTLVSGSGVNSVPTQGLTWRTERTHPLTL